MMLDCIDKLFKDFSRKGVVYCHWKSNKGLRSACEGIGDLDLLFLKSQYAQVTEALVNNSFKKTESRIDRQFPGIEDYFGYDESSGKIVHLQAHYQLVTGQPLVKNYHFPVEKEILENLIDDPATGVPVPARCLEAVLHVCRTFIKIGRRVALRPAIYKREIGKAADELMFLVPNGITSSEQKLIEKVFPFLSVALLSKGMDAIKSSVTPYRWLSIRKTFIYSLRAFERRDRFGSVLAWGVRRLYVLYLRKIVKTTPKRLLVTGGFGIAIVGSDGSGKSTVVKSLEEWMGQFLSVKTFHLGRPYPRLKTRIISRLAKQIEKISNRNLVLPSPGKLEASIWPDSLAWIPAHLYLSIAKDRWRAYRKIRRLIGRGEGVICDRFPLEGVELMDSPKIAKVANMKKSYYKNLAEKERVYYREMRRLDLTFMLAVDPETAAKRQPTDGEDYVMKRAEEIQRYVEENGEGLIRINAAMDKEAVDRMIKSIVWRTL